VSEINKTADFYISKHPQVPLKQLVLAGGVSIIPEMIAVLSGQLGMEVKVGNPFELVKMDELQTKELAGKEAFYAVAVGLAMRQDV
jgi:Tfp pilus assembly PilM family ATPase